MDQVELALGARPAGELREGEPVRLRIVVEDGGDVGSGVLVDDAAREHADPGADLHGVGLQPDEGVRPAAVQVGPLPLGIEAPCQGGGQRGRLDDVGQAPGGGVQGGLFPVDADHHLAAVGAVGQVAVHAPVDEVRSVQHGRGDVPQGPLEDPHRLGPGPPPVAAAGDEDVLVAGLLGEEVELPVEDEGRPLLVGQGRQLLPGRAAVGAAQHPQVAARAAAGTAPLGGRDQQRAVVEAGHVRVVEEVPPGVGHAGGDGEVLGEGLDVGVGHRRAEAQETIRRSTVCRMPPLR